MELQDRSGPRMRAGVIGVAGRCGSEEEKSYVKQAVFLLRYRMRFETPHAPAISGAPLEHD